MCGPECRHLLFEAARERSGCTITQLWVQYLALGGGLDLFTIEAYLHGLVMLPAAQQDVLANAVNEQLEDVFKAAMVPYLDLEEVEEPTYPDPVDVLEEMLARRRRTRLDG